MGSYPTVVDWNNDGRHDLLIGDTNGNVHVYLNTKTNTKPVLDSGGYIKADGKILNAGERAAPVVEDWNDDGKKDLLVGSMDGTIKIYLNKGPDSVPDFDSSYLLQADGKDFNIGSRSAPRVYDWNKDGLKDLLIGEMEGYVYYLKNVGTNSAPIFHKSEKLFLRSGDFLRYPDPSGNPRSRVFVTDWNNDGRDDILLGGRDGRVILYLAATKPSPSPIVLAKRTWNQLKERITALKNKSKEKIGALSIFILRYSHLFHCSKSSAEFIWNKIQFKITCEYTLQGISL